MKSSLIISLMTTIFFMSIFTFSGVRNQSFYKQEYKRALDAGTDAAAKHITYISDKNIEGLSLGFGIGLEDKNNIALDNQETLIWFYNVFFRNLDLQDDVESQNKLKEYIPMKAIISYHRISIADYKDNWIVEKDFIIDHNGKSYLFTLSNQIQDISADNWINETDIGLKTEDRQMLVSSFIKTEIESFLNGRENKESGYHYTFNIGLNDLDSTLKTIGGSNMIVLSEGIPVPSNNWFSPKQKLYAFSIGGSEISRQ